MAKRRSGTSQAGVQRIGTGGKAKAGGAASGSAGARSTPGAGGDCVYGGQEYSEGAIIDQGGVQQRCVNGKWQIVDPAHRSRPGLHPNG